MKLKKTLSLTFSCLLAFGTLGAGAGTVSQAAAQSVPGVSSTQSAPSYSKATTGAIIGATAGAIAGHNTKKGHTQHMITDAVIGGVIGGVIGNNT